MLTLGVLNLLAAISPGPDFAIVSQNTLGHSRRHGVFTALGISVALLIHISYSSFGLSYLLERSVYVFKILQWVGGAYLIYLGIRAYVSSSSLHGSVGRIGKGHAASLWLAFRQGFFTNALNPKCSLFFLSTFAYVVHQQLSLIAFFMIALELFLVVFCWFSALSWMLSHPVIRDKILKFQPVVLKLLALFLVVFGLSLIVFFHPHALMSRD